YRFPARRGAGTGAREWPPDPAPTRPRTVRFAVGKGLSSRPGGTARVGGCPRRGNVLAVEGGVLPRLRRRLAGEREFVAAPGNREAALTPPANLATPLSPRALHGRMPAASFAGW